MLDRAVKDKKHKIFSPNFRVEVQSITLPNWFLLFINYIM